MLMLFLFGLLSVTCVAAFTVPLNTDSQNLLPPVWPKRYRVGGTLNLPYAQIVEPFTGWYDADNKRSRVDFYGGMDITVQRGDLGVGGTHYQISPMTSETVFNKKSCFMLNGTAEAKIAAQHTLPNVTQFQFVGMTAFKGDYVEDWRFTKTIGTKVNRYQFYVTQDKRTPVYYEMYGYDTLLGSHFDIYKIYYTEYIIDFPDTVFDTAFQGLTCTGFPGPGHEGKILANPMQEFIHPTNDDHVHKLFNDFVSKFGKSHINTDINEFITRKNNFKHNLRYIYSINRKGLSYKLKVNHLADQTQEELGKLRGRKTTVGKYNGGKEFKPEKAANAVPDTIDWRLYGAVTPVKDQAVCGSCWSFGATGAIEGALFMKTGKLVRLSQQNLVDCSWGFGNNGCDGGEEFRAYQWVMKHGGLATSYSYGPYLGADGYCKKSNIKIGAQLTGYVNITSGDLKALKVAIGTKGPVAVGIDASHLSLSFYSHGVYYEPKCGNTPESLDHAVLAVGYGKHAGQDYWLIKNSWSTHWGNDGYVLMSQKDNNCGVATDATYVTV
eukprot:gene4738-5361_t